MEQPVSVEHQLAKLEQRLVAERVRGVPPELRRRVLERAEQELRRLRDVQRRDRWLLRAASVVLAASVCWVVAFATNYVPPAPVRVVDPAPVARRLQELVPELSEREAERLAVLFSGPQGWLE